MDLFELLKTNFKSEPVMRYYWTELRQFGEDPRGDETWGIKCANLMVQSEGNGWKIENYKKIESG